MQLQTIPERWQLWIPYMHYVGRPQNALDLQRKSANNNNNNNSGWHPKHQQHVTSPLGKWGAEVWRRGHFCWGPVMSGGRGCSRQQHFGSVHMCCCDNRPLSCENAPLEAADGPGGKSLLRPLPICFCFPQLFLYTLLCEQIDAIYPSSLRGFKGWSCKIAHMWPRYLIFPMRVSKFAGAEMDLLIALSERTPLWVEHLMRGSIVQKSNAEGRLDKCTDVTRLLDAKWAT